jgi:hypothetical protein
LKFFSNVFCQTLSALFSEKSTIFSLKLILFRATDKSKKAVGKFVQKVLELVIILAPEDNIYLWELFSKLLEKDEKFYTSAEESDDQSGRSPNYKFANNTQV